MKKFYLFFIMLLSFVGVTNVQAQDDEYRVEISKNTGSWTASGSPAYANEYETKDKEHGVRIKCANNNMTFYDGTWLSLYTAVAGNGQSYEYNVTSISSSFYISKVEFDFTPGKHPSFNIGSVSVAIGDAFAQAAEGSTESFVFENEDDNSLTKLTMIISTVESGCHAFANTSNFYVTLKPRPSMDVAWDELIAIMDAHDFSEDEFPTDGSAGSYGEAEKEAFFAALAAAHALEELGDDVTEEMLKEHGQAILDTYAALIDSKVAYVVEDGYYRFRTGMQYNDGTTKYLLSYTLDQTKNAYWGTPGDAEDALGAIWKVTRSGKDYDIVSMMSNARFASIPTSSAATLTTESGTLMAIDAAGTDGVEFFVNLRLTTDEVGGYHYVHQNGHGGGANSSGNIVGWSVTIEGTTPRASEWVLEPVSEEELAQAQAEYAEFKAHQDLVNAYNALYKTASLELVKAQDGCEGDGVITSSEQFSSPSSDADEGQDFGALIDQNPATYWHSDWHAGSVPNHSHYLQVDLADDSYALLRMTITRRAAANDHVTKWGVFGCNNPDAADGEWVELASLSTPYGNNKETISGLVFDCKGYQYLRFYIDGTSSNRGYGHFSEFQLYAVANFDGTFFGEAGEVATNLASVLEEQKDITSADVTQENLDALQAAYDAFKAIYVDPAELRAALAEAEAFAEGIVTGTNPGQWSDAAAADALKSTIADAKAYDEAGVYTPSKSTNFINTLASQMDEIKGKANTIKADTWYRIRFDSEANFEKYGWDKVAGEAVVSEEDESVQDEALWDKYVVAAKAEANDGVRSVVPIYADEARLNNNLFVDDDADIEEKALSEFRFIAVGDTAFMLQNRGTGLFVKAAGGTGGMTLSLQPSLFNVTPLGYGQNLIAAKDLHGAKQNYMHIQRSYNQVVTYDAFTPGSRSGLLLEEVGDASGYTEPGFQMDVKAGALYAMCYPVDITVEEGNGKLYSVEKVEGTHITFTEIDKAVAGQPFVYVFGEVEAFDEESTDDVVTLHHGYDLAIEPLVGSNFAGTYVQKELGAGYMVTGGALRATLGIYHNNEALNKFFMTEDFITNSVNANGAYIIPSDPDATGEITFDFDGTEDGIVEVVKNISRTGNIYSIDGRLVGRGNINSLSGMNKGVYIINGTKVVVK